MPKPEKNHGRGYLDIARAGEIQQRHDDGRQKVAAPFGGVGLPQAHGHAVLRVGGHQGQVVVRGDLIDQGKRIPYQLHREDEQDFARVVNDVVVEEQPPAEQQRRGAEIKRGGEYDVEPGFAPAGARLVVKNAHCGADEGVENAQQRGDERDVDDVDAQHADIEVHAVATVDHIADLPPRPGDGRYAHLPGRKLRGIVHSRGDAPEPAELFRVQAGGGVFLRAEHGFP